ncbi:hypothetical protein [Okeania sp. SIO1H2]|uniref:hypothetical protein n=1 Tax=Okeania sp. SIO1H2 TaxID=2607775 RepID=UPI00141C2EBD|nr:hypothetical protein [Okeania sp. SIO1H2]NET97579.1 hypothetical protein [Okeania sp. SIO1H2]
MDDQQVQVWKPTITGWLLEYAPGGKGKVNLTHITQLYVEEGLYRLATPGSVLTVSAEAYSLVEQWLEKQITTSVGEISNPLANTFTSTWGSDQLGGLGVW